MMSLGAQWARKIINPIMNTIFISVVLPVFNEGKNLINLHDNLIAALTKAGSTYEVIYVDDGSSDNSAKVLDDICIKSKCVTAIHLRRNYGQTAALMSGIEVAKGEIIILMDSDLQNDPSDIPRLLNKIEEGFDVVSGWRKHRKDAKLTRNLPSSIANTMISWISGVKLHDYGCTLKAYRAEFIKGVRLYGEMHRFIPIYAKMNGATVTELEVNHFPRIHGKSNYGLERVFKVILDLMVVKFLDRYYQKPMHVFGGVGLFAIAISLISGIYAVYLKLFFLIDFIRTPLPLLSVISLLAGLTCFLLGLIAELITRSWHEPLGKNQFQIKKITKH